jgi:hypothetical protein
VEALRDADRETLERLRREFRARWRREADFRAEKLAAMEAEGDELRAAIGRLAGRAWDAAEVEEEPPRLPPGLSESVERIMGRREPT